MAGVGLVIKDEGRETLGKCQIRSQQSTGSCQRSFIAMVKSCYVTDTAPDAGIPIPGTSPVDTLRCLRRLATLSCASCMGS